MKHYLQKLTETVRAQWGEPALADYRGGTMSFGELANAMASLHLAFLAAGIAKGDRVAICARNTSSWAVAYLAVVTSGAVAVPVLSDFTPDGIQRLVDHSESVLLFADPDIAAALDFDRLPRLNAIVSTEGFRVLRCRDEATDRAFSSREALFAGKYPGGLKPGDIAYPTDNADDLAVINYTSGTTSAPKGVMLRHDGFTAMVEFAQKSIPAARGDHVVSMLPMAHMYGLAFELLYPLISGATVHYLGKRPSPTTLMAAMRDIRPYIVITVPMVMEKIYRNSIKPALSRPLARALLPLPFAGRLVRRMAGRRLQDAFGGRVRHFVMGGAPLSPDAESCFRKIGLPFTVGYGMTEACPLLAYEDWSRFAPGSCGKPVDCAEVRIDSPDPVRVVGEIQAKGRNICMGYFKNEEATAAAFTPDGFFRTGDLGRMDRKGNLYICGRSKNLILSASGQNIYPEEVEAVVNRLDFVDESVVVDRGGRLVARVHLDSDAIRLAGLSESEVAALPDRIREAANAALPPYSRIAQVEPNPTPFEKTPKMSIKRYLYS